MGKDLIEIVIICAVVILYCKALDKLGLKEKTKRIAMVVLGTIVGICTIFYLVSVTDRKEYFFQWIFILWICMVLASEVLEIWNKEQLAKRLQKLYHIVNWILWIFIIVEVIL